MTKSKNWESWDRAYATGWLDFQHGIKLLDNPYSADQFEHQCWHLGWKACKSGSIRKPRGLKECSHE